MKISEIFITICCAGILMLAPCHQSHAQASKIVKLFSKKAVKEGAEQTGKAIGKKAVKEAAEKTTKELSEELLQKAVTNSPVTTFFDDAVLRGKTKFEIPGLKVGQLDNFLTTRVINGIGDNLFLVTAKKVGKEISSKAAREAEERFLKEFGTEISKESFEKLSKANFIDISKRRVMSSMAVRHGVKGDDALKLLDNSPGLKQSIESIAAKNSSLYDKSNLVLTRMGNAQKISYGKTASEVVVENNGIIRVRSRVSNHKESNEFLNAMLPNSHYHIDNGLTQVVTDNAGRRTVVESYTSNLYKKNPDFHSMNTSRYGEGFKVDNKKWDKIQKKELEALREGKDVWTKTDIRYTPDGKRSITTELRVVDPKTKKVKVSKSKISDVPENKSNNVAVDTKHKTPRTPQNNKNGKWIGEKGNSEYVLDRNNRPSQANHGNPGNKTVGEMGDELNDPNPSVKYKNNYPVFDKDGGTVDGKPLQTTFENGIGEYLDRDEIIRKRGKNINRENLHEAAYRKIAEQLGVSVDEVKVFKGDKAAAERLAQIWGCSIDEVFDMCNNPKKISRVLHECEDGKTVQLVPRLYHYTGLAHFGGVEKVVNEILSEVAEASL